MTNAAAADAEWARNALARARIAPGPDAVRHLSELLQAESEPRWCAIAEQVMRSGGAPVAVGLLQLALRRWPESAAVHYWMGNALRMVGDLASAERELRAVLAMDPDHAGARQSLAFMLRDAGRRGAAAAVILEHLSRVPAADAAEAQRAGRFLEEMGRYEQALEAYERQLASGSPAAAVLFGAGDVALTLGQFERARAWLLRSLEAGLDVDDYSGIWLRLASAQRYERADHPDFTLFERHSLAPERGPASRAAAGFALGKAFDDIGEYARAASAWRSANALQASLRPWRTAGWHALIEHQLRLPAQPSVPADGGGQPIFVVGLPRSGTSLIAERLARHPQVRNRGEMNWLQFLAQRLHGEKAELDAHALQRAARVYAAQMRQDDAPARLYVDKNPLNFRFLGLARALFPQGRIVHCVRDPRDVALSIWAQQFTPGEMDWAYDFASIADFIKGYETLMRHWSARSVPMHGVRYEQLVATPEASLRALGEFVGVEGLESRTQESGSAMPTASVWQARQPVHRRAVARWERYAPYIPELAQFGK